MNNQILNATLASFVAQREEAKAVLLTYFSNSVGIADHSNIIGETTAWTSKLAEANECIAALTQAFIPKEETMGSQDVNVPKT